MAEIPNRRPRQKKKIGALYRGEVYLCSFDPTVGHEIKKTRPALVNSERHRESVQFGNDRCGHHLDCFSGPYPV